MSTPATLRDDRFLALPSPAWSKINSDDYVHKKLETIKFKAVTGQKGKFDYKSVVSVNDKDQFSYSDELKFGFPYRSIYY